MRTADRDSHALVATETELQKSNLEVRKLELEIDQLERDSGIRGFFSDFAAPFSVILAAGGLVFGFFRYRRDELKERRVRAEEGIADNLQRLIDAVRAKSSINAQAVSALRNLETLVEQVERADDQRSSITDALVELTSDDIDLENYEQAKFDLLCLNRWQPYRVYWEEQTEENAYVLSQYVEALARLVSSSNPQAFHEARWHNGAVQIDESVDGGTYRHFLRLAAGYRKRVAQLSAEPKQAAVTRFGSALGNQDLADRLLHAPSENL